MDLCGAGLGGEIGRTAVLGMMILPVAKSKTFDCPRTPTNIRFHFPSQAHVDRQTASRTIVVLTVEAPEIPCVADLLRGSPFSVQRAEDRNFGNGKFWSFYGQDNYRATRSLTINVGLRWEMNSMLDGVRGRRTPSTSLPVK